MPIFDLYDGRRSRRWAYALRIAGMPYVYHCGPTPPDSAMPDTWTEDGPDWVPVRAITNLSAVSESLPQLGGLGTQSPITITLSSGGDLEQHPGSPGIVFSRLGVKGATWWSTITGFNYGDVDASRPVLPHDADTPFVIYTTLAEPALEYPRVVHVGQESFIASFGEENSITISDRAVGDTVARRHECRAEARDLPVLTTDEIVFWRSRRAVLVGYQIKENGSVGSAVEVLRGFIERTPEVGSDGLSINIQLVPLVALAGQEANLPIARTTLAKGVHYFVPGQASHFRTSFRVNQWRGAPAADALVGDGEVEVVDEHLAQWAATFDPTLQPDLSRSGSITLRLEGRDVRGSIDSVGAGPARLIFDDEDAPYQQIHAVANDLRTLETFDYGNTEVVDVDIVGPDPILMLFPGTVVDDGSWMKAFVDSAVAATDTHLGADGRWARLSINSDSITWTSNTHPEGLPPICGVYSEPQGRRDDIAIVTPFIWTETIVIGAGEPDVYPGTAQAFEPVSGHLFIETRLIPADEGEKTVPYGGMAIAWYQRGESYLLVEDSIDVSSGSLLINSVQVAVSDILIEVEVPDGFAPEGSPAEEYNGGSLWLITLLEPSSVSDIYQGPGDEEVEILVDTPSFETSGELLVHLLTAAEHLALGESDIDIASIRADGGDPPWVLSWGIPDSEDPLTYAQVIDGILKASRSALVMSTDSSGRNRVTRVPVGVERPALIAAVIGQSDWSSDTTPAWGTDDRLINRLTVRAEWVDVSDNLDRSEFDWEFDETYQSRTSQRLFEETTGAEIDLYSAIEVDRESDSLTRFSITALSTYETPRRTWTGKVGTYLGLRAHLGGTVQVTSRHLRDYAGLPVVELLGVVVERQIDLWNEGITIRLVHNGISVQGWNASMKVASVVNPSTVTVEPNAYSSPNYPTEDGSAYRDLTPFDVGQSVRCLPAVDQDDGTVLEITAIDRDELKITFDGLHGLVVGDIITPPTHGGAEDIFKLYAYLAGSDGTLGGSEDDGHQYV